VVPTRAAHNSDYFTKEFQYTTGTYGRFQYVPSRNAFILVNAVDQNVYFYKLGISGGSLDPFPTVDLQVNPSPVSLGASATLSWSSTGATICEASSSNNSWVGTKATQGSETTGAVTEDRSYTLACTGSAGTAQRTVELTVDTGGSGGGGGTAPPPDDGGSVPPPDDGGSVPPPDDGGTGDTDTIPDSGTIIGSTSSSSGGGGATGFLELILGLVLALFVLGRGLPRSRELPLH
jgi:hypothetical protein